MSFEAPPALSEDQLSGRLFVRFNLLSLVKYKKQPEEREFSMIWEILFHSEKSYSVVKRENVGQHTTSADWGAILNLLHYRRTPTKTQFDFLWILPITFRNDEGS